MPPKNTESSLKEDVIVVNEVASLKEALQKEKIKAEDYLNRLKYLQAEFENYQKRLKKDVADSIQFGNQRLITELLTVLDELEYAVNAGKRSNNKEALIQGVEITLKKLYGILQNEGVSKIEAIGKPFDPMKHNAVEKVGEGDSKETVCEEIRPGFTLKGKVIRPSLVKVVMKSSITTEKGDKE